MQLIKNSAYEEKYFSSDKQFNELYPLAIQSLARRHWTPLDVARKAANYLAAEDNVKILDIGSGVGKFCLSAAHFKHKAWYCGIEQRKSLIEHAENVRDTLQSCNVSFIHGNFTQLNFKNFDHFISSMLFMKILLVQIR